MKKTVFVISLLLSLSVPCFSSESHYQLMINGKMNHAAEPILEKNNGVFISVKDTILLLSENYEVKQNEAERSVIILEDGHYSYLKEGRLFGIVRNKIVRLPQSCFYENGELYLPASLCAKITGHYFIKSKSYLQFFKW